MNLYTKSLLLLAVAIVQSYGAIYDQVSQLPTDTYDYIVVGGTLSTTPMCQWNELIHNHR